MADYLALNWEKSELTGIEATVSGSAVSIKQSFHIVWPDELNPTQDPISAGSWLKNEFSRLNISVKNVLISFPRHDTTIRVLEIPDVPIEEVPEIVRFQAATKSSVPLGQLLLDHLLLPVREGKEARDVLVASIVRELHDQAVNTFQSMGMDVISTGVSAISVAEWIAHVGTFDKMSDPTLIVNQVDHHLEMSLVNDQQLLFTNSTSMTSADREVTEQSMITEVNRFLLASSSQLAGQKTKQIILIGEQQAQQSFSKKLSDRFRCAVEFVDPSLSTKSTFSDSHPLEYPGVLAGPMGMLYSQAQKSMEVVDFLNPHKAEVKPDRRKLQIGLGVAGVVLIFMTALFLTQRRVSDLDEQIVERQNIQNGLNELLKRGKPTLESVTLIENWEHSNSKSLKVLNELDTVLPGTDRLYLSDMSLNRSAGQSISRLRAMGHAKDDLDVRDLNRQLSNDNYRVHPKRSNNSTFDSDYPVPFEIDAERLPPQVNTQQKPKAEKVNKS
ncbi:type IV pilus biogenesis protein PilM [Gimesia aquarii]|uniref:Competence protein A n=1 Tax=Gimesia aquarii TaxID=2527964 RepID=A0A517VR94_9PLAN|nr:hypothetical protein [Gimesia aquarii]QDT95460.1 Competence protein A [Gimesia aquarii]